MTRVRVACATKECSQFEVIKEIALVHVGQGVFMSGLLICGECGYAAPEVGKGTPFGIHSGP